MRIDVPSRFVKLDFLENKFCYENVCFFHEELSPRRSSYKFSFRHSTHHPMRCFVRDFFYTLVTLPVDLDPRARGQLHPPYRIDLSSYPENSPQGEKKGILIRERITKDVPPSSLSERAR